MQKNHVRRIPLRELFFLLHSDRRFLLYFGTPGLRSIEQTINFPGRPRNAHSAAFFNPPLKKLEVDIMSSRILKTSVSIAAFGASLALLFAVAWVGLAVLGH